MFLRRVEKDTNHVSKCSEFNATEETIFKVSRKRLLAAVAAPAALWLLAIITDTQKDRQAYWACVHMSCSSCFDSGNQNLADTSFFIHVQHNDGTGVCIIMSLALPLWSCTQDTTTEPTHAHKHTVTDFVIIVVSGHTLAQQTYRPDILGNDHDDPDCLLLQRQMTHAHNVVMSIIIVTIRWEKRGKVSVGAHGKPCHKLTTRANRFTRGQHIDTSPLTTYRRDFVMWGRTNKTATA